MDVYRLTNLLPRVVRKSLLNGKKKSCVLSISLKGRPIYFFVSYPKPFLISTAATGL